MMTTKEYIEKMESLGYVAKNNNGNVIVSTLSGDVVVIVSSTNYGILDTKFLCFSKLSEKEKEIVITHSVDYVTTPMGNRGDLKKYYLIVPNATGNNEKCLKVRISDNKYHFSHKLVTNENFKSVFTDEEINDLPHQDFIESLIKEEVK